MRVDFYVLGQLPAERIVPALAARALAAGERMVVVSEDAAQRAALSDALWQHEGFLAHGEDHPERQPIVIAPAPGPACGAGLLCIADGQWRGDAEFARVFYLFDDDRREAAREIWRDLSTRRDIEAFFWKREGGKWRQGP